MCGIFGIYTTHISARERKVFDTLGVVSNLRGSEGSGVVTAHRDDKIGSYKILGDGIDLLYSKGFSDLVGSHYSTSASTIIGHTRAPTKGGKDKDAVHPHDGGRVIGVHNGTLFRVNEKVIPQAQSDSKAAYADIAERGIDAFVEGADGAYCLVYIDKQYKTLNFIRNAQRPLWFAKIGTGIKKNPTQDPVTIFWSSERIFLQFALMRENFREDEYILEDLPINQLTSYPMIARGPIKTPEVRQIAKVFPTRTTAWTSGTSGAAGHTHTQGVPYDSYRARTGHNSRSTVLDARSGGTVNTKSVTRWIRFYGKDPNELIVDIVKVIDTEVKQGYLYRSTWSNGSITETEGFPAAKYATGCMQKMFNTGQIRREDVVPFDMSQAKTMTGYTRPAVAKETISLPLQDDEVPFTKDDEVSTSEAMEDLFVNAYSKANVQPHQRLTKAEKRAQRRMTKALARANRQKTMAALHEHMDKQSQLETPNPEESVDACSVAVPLLDDIDPGEDAEEEVVLHETIKNHYLTDEEFTHVTQRTGCAWCTGPSYKNDKRYWFSHDEFMCDTCIKDDYARRFLGVFTDDDLDKRSVH